MHKARRIGCRGGWGEIRLPQRHRNAGNAAVVEEGGMQKARRIGCRGGWGEMRLPQRH